MSRLEQIAFPLAGGALCVFVGAVVLKDAPWQAGFVAVAVAVVGWGLRAPVVVGGVLGTVAWAMVTGFDVVKTGSLALTGPDDALRAGLLVGCGLMARPTLHVMGGQSCRPWVTPRSVPPARGLRPAVRSRAVSARGHSVNEGKGDV
ncbi:hypothetical protein ACH35V_29890 [Actinomadura sp. 1N219]|uniref:hypothetical protein n=1 Tax=Actinomadura sp. 1N219 TaxID=3375152 RepID=UPI003790141C